MIVPIEIMKPPKRRGWRGFRVDRSDVWRMPDRDIHRFLVLRGPKRTKDVAESLQLARDVAASALKRMERQRVIASHRVPHWKLRGQFELQWFARAS